MGRVPAAILAFAPFAWSVWGTPAPGLSQAPAGLTGAVLSFIDAAAGRVEVVRHWPQASADVDVYPFVPYFWTGCPGPGAVIVLVTAPAPAPGGPASHLTDIERSRAVAGRIRASIRTAAHGDPDEPAAFWRLLAGTPTPGDPVAEAAKAIAPQIADLTAYERRGYAVFAFITWEGWRCGVIFRAVPEGYSIPFVR
jgi:hypothetical protein